MTEEWRLEIREWAQRVTHEFGQREGVVGVMIGGSIARGQEWPHSDLEMGLLVDDRIASIPYFNVIEGRGVEAIQVVRPKLEEQFQQIENGDLSPVAQWPIQLWFGNIVNDPTGVFTKFKEYFYDNLFSEPVVQMKLAIEKEKISETLKDAVDYLEHGQPLAALTRTRYAMNEAILALHWHYHELPRSQNRTDSRLKALCEKYDNPVFYQLYRDVFSLDQTENVIQNVLPDVQDDVLKVTRLWGDSAHDFFKYAVDSNFEWGQNGGILTVYRLYVPIIGGDQSLLTKMDDPQWAKENQGILTFLGLKDVESETVEDLITQLINTVQKIYQ